MENTPEKWLVVCVKDARGYTRGSPMPGERTREEAAARAAAMSDICPGCFVAMPKGDFYASIDDENVLDKYLPPFDGTDCPETAFDSGQSGAMNDPAACLRAVYSPVNQAWFVVFGKKGKPIESWSVTDIGGKRIWQGKKRGRLLLVEDLARMGLRFVPGAANFIMRE